MKGLAVIFAVILGLGSYWAWTAIRPIAETFGFGRVRHEWNQKLTLTVATPDGPKTGAAVVTVAAVFGNTQIGNEVFYGHKGEATVVEVAPGKYLFALLSGSDERFFYDARDRFEGKRRGEWLYDIPNQTEPVELTGKGVPLLVTFADINDPTTVTRVDPDDLDAAFGCDRYDGAALPWRVAGVPLRTWADREYRRQKALEIARRLGLNGPEVEALAKVSWVWRENSVPSADRAAFDVAVEQLGEEQFYAMRDMDQSGVEKFDIQRPRIEDFSLPTCHSLTSVTLGITGDPVTEGRVEGVLGWLGSYKKNQWRLNGEKCIACPVSNDRLADLTHPSDFLLWGR